MRSVSERTILNESASREVSSPVKSRYSAEHFEKVICRSAIEANLCEESEGPGGKFVCRKIVARKRERYGHFIDSGWQDRAFQKRDRKRPRVR